MRFEGTQRSAFLPRNDRVRLRGCEAVVKPGFDAALEPEAAGVELVGVRGDLGDEDGADSPVGEAVVAEDVAGLGAGEEAVTHGGVRWGYCLAVDLTNDWQCGA